VRESERTGADEAGLDFCKKSSGFRE